MPLPADLYQALDAIKGDMYLWQHLPAELKGRLKAKRVADAPPGRPVITSHLFRETAYTKEWAAGIDPRRATIAIGCNVDTMMRHYVQMDEQQVTDLLGDPENRNGRKLLRLRPLL